MLESCAGCCDDSAVATASLFSGFCTEVVLITSGLRLQACAGYSLTTGTVWDWLCLNVPVQELPHKFAPSFHAQPEHAQVKVVAQAPAPQKTPRYVQPWHLLHLHPEICHGTHDPVQLHSMQAMLFCPTAQGIACEKADILHWHPSLHATGAQLTMLHCGRDRQLEEQLQQRAAQKRKEQAEAAKRLEAARQQQARQDEAAAESQRRAWIMQYVDQDTSSGSDDEQVQPCLLPYCH